MIESDSDSSDDIPQEYVSQEHISTSSIAPKNGLTESKTKPADQLQIESPEPQMTSSTPKFTTTNQNVQPHDAEAYLVTHDNPTSTTIDATPPPCAPATLSASAVLPSLPPDTAAILDKFSQQLQQSTVKCQLRFRPIGGATPVLKQAVYKIAETQQFGVVVKFLKKQLKIKTSGNSQLFCYISSFAPGLDETIGSLSNRYAIRGELTVSYCLNQAFG